MSRPYPYGTVLRLTHEAIDRRLAPRSINEMRLHAERRYMVITDRYEDIECIALVTEYDDAETTHSPRADWWEPVDEA